MTVSIDELERAAAYGWRAPEQASLGDWLLRAAEGFTGRANSVLAIGDPGLPLEAAVERIRYWYQSRGLPPMISVAFPVGRPHESAVDRFLAERGWSVHHGATVMTADLAAVPPRPADAVAHADVAEEPDEGWLRRYRYRGQVPPPISRLMLMSAPWQAFASVREAGQTLAIGRVALGANWAGLTAIEVDPRHRRRGLGRVVTAALVGAAAERGVHDIYLQVESDNAAASELYRQLGFTDHHAYHYRIAPGSA